MLLRESRTAGPRGPRIPEEPELPFAHGSVDSCGIVLSEWDSYQRLAHSLMSLHSEGQSVVLLVAGAIHQDGASTVARKLAATLNKSTVQPVLLVDANLRDPSQHEVFHTPRSPGFSDVIRHSFKRIPVADGVQNGFYLLPCGEPIDKVPRLFSDPALRRTIERWRSSFDWIVLDGPPVTAYSDSSVLAGLTDGVILVVQAEKTRWEVAEQARKTLEDAGGRLLGSVLNRRRYHIPTSVYRRL